MWETSLQERIPRAAPLAGECLQLDGGDGVPAGRVRDRRPVAMAIGVSTTLWIGAAWIVLSTIALLSVTDVRNFRARSVGAEALASA